MFFREPGAVFWAFGFPLLLTLALGVAFRNRPPDPVPVAVEDGLEAGALRDKLLACPAPCREPVQVRVLDKTEATRQLRTGKVALVVVPGAPLVYRLDESHPESRLARLVVDERLQRETGAAPLHEEQREPGARYVDFLVPGLMGSNVMSTGMWGVGFVIVDMRTKKLLKRMLATPMRRGDFLLSFVLMRMLFLALEIPVLIGFGWLFFDVRVHGSLALLALVLLVGALAFAGLGLLVASRAENTQTAGGLMNLVMLPMFMGSGVFFATSRFPDALQPVLRALPLTALNDALRAVMTEGLGVGAVLRELAVLMGWAVGTYLVALRLFRWR